MAFYIVSKGKISAFDFEYLDSIRSLRLEPTRITRQGGRKSSSASTVKKAGGEKPLFAIELMVKNPFTLSPMEKISKVKALMKNKSIHHIPIILNEKIYGIFSDTDLPKVKGAHRDQLSIHLVMSKLVVCADEETPVQHIAQVFWHENIRAMLVLDKNGKLSGILTQRDLLRWALEQKKYTRQV